MHRLRVRASDLGSPWTLSTLCSVEVTVLDVNHRPPVFLRRDYVSMVPEDVAVGTLLLSIFAASSNASVNAQTRYSITSGNEQGAFSIDSHTGTSILLCTQTHIHCMTDIYHAVVFLSHVFFIFVQ